MPGNPRYPNQRVGIFVDVQNLYHSAKNLYQGRVNYAELIKHLTGGRQLVRALAYVVKSEGVEPQRAPGSRERAMPVAENGESSFFEALEKAGLELRMKDIQIYAGGMKKADWDIGMAIDAVRLKDALDVVVLVTGDGDFIPLIEYLQIGNGKIVEVAAFRRSANSKLQEIADKFINIETVPRAIMKTRRAAGNNL